MLLIFRPFLVLLLVVASVGSSAGSTEADMRRTRGKHQKGRKLFVFGDSYADTGNWRKGTGVCWEEPYGSTFPGKPVGRFSDGRILTDYIASYLGIRSQPVPYTQRRSSPSAGKKLKFGMNFAYGGTGVFNTGASQPNMTTQIDIFQNVLASESTYTAHDLRTSVALVALGGNDCANLLRPSPSQQEAQRFTKSMVEQLVSNLKRIHSLGIPKVAVTGLEPSVAELNSQTSDSATAFFVLDLYSAFMSGLNTPQLLQGNIEGGGSALEPCCHEVGGGFGCGSRDGNRTEYKVCAVAGGAFFWDSVHPAQQGWHLVFLSLESSLKHLLE